MTIHRRYATIDATSVSGGDLGDPVCLVTTLSMPEYTFQTQGHKNKLQRLLTSPASDCSIHMDPGLSIFHKRVFLCLPYFP